MACMATGRGILGVGDYGKVAVGAESSHKESDLTAVVSAEELPGGL
jgi:hypothetical protein